MSKFQPICVGEKAAAAMLDLPVEKFRSLVESGHLPRGVEIAPSLVRWRVTELKAIAEGDAMDGMGDVRW